MKKPRKPAGDRHAIPPDEAKRNLGDYLEEAPRPVGRPSKYDPNFAEQAEKLCLLGATDVDLADFFDTSVVAIWRWATKHEEFRNALKAGKAAADQRVERSLFQRAVGYTHDATKIFMPANAQEPVYAAYREHVSPDTTACIFWLKNRKKDEWRDVNRQELSGPNGGSIMIDRIVREIVDPKET